MVFAGTHRENVLCRFERQQYSVVTNSKVAACSGPCLALEQLDMEKLERLVCGNHVLMISLQLLQTRQVLPTAHPPASPVRLPPRDRRQLLPGLRKASGQRWRTSGNRS